MASFSPFIRLGFSIHTDYAGKGIDSCLEETKEKKGISIGENEWVWKMDGRKEIWECGKKELL
jgi:hypothetical protein